MTTTQAPTVGQLASRVNLLTRAVQKISQRFDIGMKHRGQILSNEDREAIQVALHKIK